MGLREEARQAQLGDDSEGAATAALARSAVTMAAKVTPVAEGEGAPTSEQNGRHGVPDTHVYDPEADRHVADGAPQRELEALRGSIQKAQVKAAPARPSEPVVIQSGTLHLTPKQYEMLLRPINPNRVKQRQGQSHLEAWDVRRHLARIFGFGGFEITTVSKDKIFDHIAAPGEIVYGNGGTNKRPAYTVVYDCVVRLKVYGLNGTSATYEDAATGDGSNMPSYQAAADFAIKTAFSQALKRCAVNLGDQFGLSLYNGGSYNPVINVTLVGPVEVGGPDVVEQAVQSDVVRSEQETPEYLADPGRHDDADQETGMPSANALRDEALDLSTSVERLSAILAMVHRTKGSHPAYGGTYVINETGDKEALDRLVWRKKQERQGA